MVQIKLLNGEISIFFDETVRSKEDLLKELNIILCFTIVIYKRRIEMLQHIKLSELDEAIINQKIKESIVMIPLAEVRESVDESGN